VNPLNLAGSMLSAYAAQQAAKQATRDLLDEHRRGSVPHLSDATVKAMEAFAEPRYTPQPQNGSSGFGWGALLAAFLLGSLG
jgi:hypothetical protein